MKFDFEANASVDSLDKIPECYRPLYKEDGGKHVFDKDRYGPTITMVAGLNGALDKARANEKKTPTVDLSELADFGTDIPSIAKNVKAKLEEATKAQPNLEKVRQELKAAHDKEMGTLTKQRDGMRGTLERYLINSAAVEAIASEKGVPDLLLPHIAKQVKVVQNGEDYVAVVVDKDGDPRIDPLTGQAMSLKALVKEMKASETFARAFDSDSPPGGGKLPGTGKLPLGGGQRKTELSSNEKIAQGLKRRGIGGRG